MQDPLADALTRIRNAQQAKLAEVKMPSSKTRENVVRVLKEEGYVEDYSISEGSKPELTVRLKYHQGRPVIEEIQRISRPGFRQYSSAGDIPYINGGLGVVILSTNKGVMTDRAARSAGVGGEMLCSVF